MPVGRPGFLPNLENGFNCCWMIPTADGSYGWGTTTDWKPVVPSAEAQSTADGAAVEFADNNRRRARPAAVRTVWPLTDLHRFPWIA